MIPRTQARRNRWIGITPSPTLTTRFKFINFVASGLEAKTLLQNQVFSQGTESSRFNIKNSSIEYKHF